MATLPLLQVMDATVGILAPFSHMDWCSRLPLVGSLWPESTGPM
jgi:hypothetical protein